LKRSYASGIRVTELIQLETIQSDGRRGIIIGIWKRIEERLVPIGRSARQWIEEYQKQSRIHLTKTGKSQDYLFLNIRGTKLTRDMIRKLVKSILKLQE